MELKKTTTKPNKLILEIRTPFKKKKKKPVNWDHVCRHSFIHLHVVLLAADLLQGPLGSQGYVLLQFLTRLMSTIKGVT